MEKTKKRISIDLAHQLGGDYGEDKTQCMSKSLGFQLTRGNIQKCISCAVAKANLKNVPKKSPHEPSNKDNGRVFLDISIDVVLDEDIWTVNWLHYLNYEPIACTSITRHLVCTRNVLGQTVSSYGWCNGIPRFIPLFGSFSE